MSKPIHLSCILITKNAAETLARTLSSVIGLADEIIVVDDRSTDATVEIAESYSARVIHNPETSEGRQRVVSLNAARGEWVLCLDSDEVVSPELYTEIQQLLIHSRDMSVKAGSGKDRFQQLSGYFIPYTNFFLGRPVRHGGESYQALRLFRRDAVEVDVQPIHATFQLTSGRSGVTNGTLYHYSYRSLAQLFRKFTQYSFREADRKHAAGERSGIKQITLYPVHMFYARFIEDKGYKDGLHRIPLDLAFAYMEFLTYWLLLTRYPNR
jgi:glycosyltransferase involved in cell wall biosynthesis